MTAISPYEARVLDGRKLYNCDGPDCPEQRTVWGKNWIHYSSYKDQEEDPYGFPTFCSVKCAENYRVEQFKAGETPIPPVNFEVPNA